MRDHTRLVPSLLLAATLSIAAIGCSGGDDSAAGPAVPVAEGSASAARTTDADSANLQDPPTGETIASAPEVVNPDPGMADDAAEAPAKVTMADEAALAKAVKETRGKNLVVNLWATWCPPCVREMPELIAFAKAADPEKTAFLSVSLDEPDSVEQAVIPFVKDKGIPFHVYVWSGDFDPDSMARALGAEITGVLPTTLFFNGEGDVLRTWEGPITQEEIEQIFAEAA